jgi:hypothetical protein
MQRTRLTLGLGLLLLSAPLAHAEITKGVLAIKGAEMS